MNQIELLIGKRVLFFDLETTGFPRSHKDKIDYRNNQVYDSSRIVQIGWCYYDQFPSDLNIEDDSVKSHIRKPVDFFSISQRVVDIHKISFTRAKKEGVEIEKILDGEFGRAVLKCDYIVSYNIQFDFGILANEIHRAGDSYAMMFEKMLALEQSNTLCLMKATANYLGKLSSQPNAYLKMYGVQADMQHDARGDVYAMLKILKFMMEHKKLPDSVVKVDKLDNQVEAKDAHQSGDDRQSKDMDHLAIRVLGTSTDEVNSMKRSQEQITHNLFPRSGTKTQKDNHHSAKQKVYKKLKDDSDPLFNRGKGWTPEEEETMKVSYLDDNLSIHDIAMIHKRTIGSISARLKKLDLLKEADKVVDKMIVVKEPKVITDQMDPIIDTSVVFPVQVVQVVQVQDTPVQHNDAENHQVHGNSPEPDIFATFGDDSIDVSDVMNVNH